MTTKKLKKKKKVLKRAKDSNETVEVKLKDLPVNHTGLGMMEIDKLKLHPKNRNRHPDHQIKRLAEILQYQGFRYPIKVSKQSGYVTSGHGRIEAAKLMGWTHVPVSVQSYDNDDQEYADMVADNAIASWAELDLSGINKDLIDLGPFDINLLGIDDFKVDVGELDIQGSTEIDANEFQSFTHKCPKCEFEWTENNSSKFSKE